MGHHFTINLCSIVLFSLVIAVVQGDSTRSPLMQGNSTKVNATNFQYEGAFVSILPLYFITILMQGRCKERSVCICFKEI